MKRSLRAGLLCLLLLLSGCARSAPVLPPETEGVPAATVPPDGDPHSITRKGSYTGQPDPETIAARMEGAALTNGELQVWYWAEIARHRQTRLQSAPDFDLPLDTQPCEIDGSVASWQQYFLRAALDRWHTAHALIRHSQEVPLPTEEAYKSNRGNLHKYMDGMPATRVLYGYNEYYSPNTLHQAYLDTLPEALESLAKDMGCTSTGAMAREAFGASEEALAAFARDYNYGYMYFTTLSYALETAESPAEGTGGDRLVDIRQILLLPEEGETFSDCQSRAIALLESWLEDPSATESSFAQLASRHSQDPGSAPSGGLYRRLRQGQTAVNLDRWCFDSHRREGDTAIIPGEEGCHIVYFVRSTDPAEAEALLSDRAARLSDLLAQIREEYPIRIDYSAITLAEAAGTVSSSQILYPDIAHERFPEVPLYLQQDYSGTMYGTYKITTNGCGITTLAMIASYLTDDELTPPEMCARYGSFSRKTGTDGSLFEKAPPQLGFYLIKKTYDWREAREYMQEGHPVVVVQYRGYWTSGGHYLVLEALSQEGLVQVRDSNMYNYAKLIRHQEDLFPWDTLTSAGMGYWIYEKKVTSTAACTRCGDPEALEPQIVTDYLCEKCETALVRRNAYLGTTE